MNENIEKTLKSCSQLVDDKLIEYINGFYKSPESLKEGILYSVRAGGKRLRPSLMITSYQAGGGKDIDEVLPFACAIEMIHTYSLIHDDLPSMDNDDYRRGKLSNHRMFGEANAILAGDALLNGAYEIIINSINGKKSINAAKTIALSSGAQGMVGGQVFDMEGVNDEESLYRMNLMKTGKLIEASVIAGAYLAGADNDIIDFLRIYAQNIGIAFQIRDDILDAMEKKSSDAINGKITFVSFYGIKKAEELLYFHTEKAVDALKELSPNYSFFIDIAYYLREREK